jgi:hypothetical protein
MPKGSFQPLMVGSSYGLSSSSDSEIFCTNEKAMEAAVTSLLSKKKLSLDT